jgi:transcriptional regulator with XRE-family HTH domain
VDNNSTVHPIKAALRKRWPPMSQAKLARSLDLNPSSLTLILSGQRTPPEGFYIAAAGILGCEPDDLKPREVAAA